MAESRSPGITSSSPVNSANQVESRLKSLSQKNPLKLLHSALGKDAKLAVVGGTLREAFLGNLEADLDLASLYEPVKIKSLLDTARIGTYDTGLQHGTITAVIDKQNIEITTFRKSDGKGGNSFSQTLEEDLSARDFTVNAIAFDLNESKIVDPLNGIKDLEDKVLRACSEPLLRFKEDPLRILRMIRFGPAAGREIESNTLSAALSITDDLNKISIERIRLELEKILMAEFPEVGIRALAEHSLLKFIVPELIESIGFEQNKFHYEDVFEHTLTVIKNSPHDLRLRLAALFHDIGKPKSLSVGEDGNRHFYLHEEIGAKITKNAMKRLKFSNQQIDDVVLLVKMHMRPLDCGPAGVRRLMRDLGDLFDDWKLLKRADYPPIMQWDDFETRYNAFMALVNAELERIAKSGQKTLAIDGNDLIALGEKPGKQLGNILKFLENLVIENPELNEKTVLLEKAKSIIKGETSIS